MHGFGTLAPDGWAITLTSGQTDSGNDFGNFQLINKTGSKYVDDEGDGSISGDSKYTGGWTISIYKDDGDNTLDAGDTVTSVVTDATGNYAFNDLGPGTYFVCEATASDWIQTFPNTVAGEVINTCDNIAGNAEFGYKFTAASGVDQTLNDFGNFQLINKTGSKYVDDEGDGSISGDSKYTGGWTINIYKDDGDNTLDAGDTVTSVVTDAHRQLRLQRPGSGHLLRVRGDRLRLDPDLPEHGGWRGDRHLRQHRRQCRVRLQVHGQPRAWTRPSTTSATSS